MIGRKVNLQAVVLKRIKFDKKSFGLFRSIYSFNLGIYAVSHSLPPSSTVLDCPLANMQLHVPRFVSCSGDRTWKQNLQAHIEHWNKWWTLHGTLASSLEWIRNTSKYAINTSLPPFRFLVQEKDVKLTKQARTEYSRKPTQHMQYLKEPRGRHVSPVWKM